MDTHSLFIQDRLIKFYMNNATLRRPLYIKNYISHIIFFCLHVIFANEIEDSFSPIIFMSRRIPNLLNES